MKFRWNKKYLYWGTTAFLVVCASMLFYFVLFRMDVLFDGVHKIVSIMMPIICGAIIAYLLIPIVNFMEKKWFFPLLSRQSGAVITRRKRKAVRFVSIFLALLLALLVIYSLIAMIMPSIIESVISIINDSPRYFQNIQHWLESLLKNNPQWQTMVLDNIETFSPRLEAFLNSQVLPQLKELLQHLTTGVFGTLVFIKNVLIGLIISIYLMLDKEKLVTQSKMCVYALFDAERANHIVQAFRFTHKTFGGFISGKIIDSLIIGILCYIGTSLIGTPYQLLVSVVVGVTNVIPFFGPYLGAIPSAFLILMVNPLQCLYFLIFILILQQFDGNILGPKILGDSTGLTSFMVIVAILLFGGLFGVPGMIIGVPLWAVIIAAIKYFREEALKKKSMPSKDGAYENMDYLDPRTLKPVLRKPSWEESAHKESPGSEEEEPSKASEKNHREEEKQ